MVDLRGMVALLLLTSPPRALRAVGGGSAAGPPLRDMLRRHTIPAANGVKRT